MSRISGSVLALGLIALSAFGQPTSAILFIGDGMGVAQITAARIYSANARDGKLTLDTFEQVALVRTYASNTMVTDSAASGTAMATGQKTDTMMIGQLPDGTPLESVLVKAKRAGKSVGIVTTTTVTHATPASFYAHIENRYNELSIAEQLIDYGEIDVVFGGGRRYFLPKESEDSEPGTVGMRKDSRNLVDEAMKNGYRYISRASEFNALRSNLDSGKNIGKVLGLFRSGLMSYELDRDKNSGDEPSLEEMTRMAISILQRNPKGYFLMVEGGRIDHAGHSNNAKKGVNETLEFDRTVKAGLDLADDNTLIIVTADHETAGMAINGYASVEIGGDTMFTEPAGRGGDHIVTFATGPGGYRETEKNKARDEANYRQPSAVATDEATHTGVDVVAYSSGPGSERFRGTLDNTEIGENLIQLLGLE